MDLTQEQLDWLAGVVAREGISRAEAIRRAVEASMEKDCEADFQRVLAAAAGSWKGYGIDGLEYQQRVRSEWDRD